MKKSITFIAAIAMAATMATAIPASAANEVTINYKVEPYYVIEIPDEAVTLSSSGTEIKVGSSDVYAAPGKQLAVSVAGQSESWTMTGESGTVGYSVTQNEAAVAVGGVVHKAAAGKAETMSTFIVTPNDTCVVGTYSDVLTFTADFVDVEKSQEPQQQEPTVEEGGEEQQPEE